MSRKRRKQTNIVEQVRCGTMRALNVFVLSAVLDEFK